MSNDFPQPHLKAKEAAKLMGLTAKTLRNWRSDCLYIIPYIKRANGHVYYSLSHVEQFIEDRAKFKRTISKQELSF